MSDQRKRPSCPVVQSSRKMRCHKKTAQTPNLDLASRSSPPSPDPEHPGAVLTEPPLLPPTSPTPFGRGSAVQRFRLGSVKRAVQLARLTGRTSGGVPRWAPPWFAQSTDSWCGLTELQSKSTESGFLDGCRWKRRVLKKARRFV